MLGRVKSIQLAEPAGLTQAVILFLFCFPLFFQLSGSIFVAPDAIYESQGSLSRLPLPFASVFCFIGIALFLRLEESYFSMGFVFAFFMFMMLSAIISSSRNEGTVELAKFIHLVQYVLPSFALVLGRLYQQPVSKHLRIEAIVLYVLVIIIPLEVVATIFANHTLAAHLFLFSLYQHFQYLPVVFLGFFFFTAASFYERSHSRCIVIFLAPWMGIYVAQSISASAMLLGILGSVVFAWILIRRKSSSYAFLVLLLAFGAYLIYSPYAQGTLAYSSKFGERSQSSASEITEYGLAINRLLEYLPTHLKNRINYWRFYGDGVFESLETFFFGHASRADRTNHPSAHNYYLDLVYNFGVISLLPFILLVHMTIRRCRMALTDDKNLPSLAMLAAIVFYFVFIDNNFKVGFSQPYPGMMMFFFWGILLTRISEHTNHQLK